MGKKAKKAAVVPREMTKRQLSRHQREQRLNRIAVIGVAAVLALLVLVVAFGYYREVLAKPGETIARVDGKQISLGDFAKVLAYNDFNVDAQRAQLQDLMSQSASDDPSQDFARQFAQQNIQQLEFRKRLLPSETLNEMIEGELIRQEVTRRGITVSATEVDDFLVEQFSAADAPPPAAEESGALTDEATTSTPATTTETLTAPTDTASSPTTAPAPTTTITKTIAEVNEEIRKALAQTNFLTLEEYRRFIVEPFVYRERLQEAISAEVPTSGEQVRARHILVETEEAARDVLRMLKNEGQSFDEVAKQMSTDEANKETGGDLGWFARGRMDPAFEDAAFGLPVGELSEPVNTTFGFHIILVEERADDRAFSEQQLNELRAGAFAKWLDEQKQPEANRVQEFDTPDRLKWANDWVAAKRQELARQASAAAPQPQ